ncbi:MAG: hypothetical protein HFF20_07440 [Oscillospiraceae bacterium]|nr:hypothetical protein [Oscillospiraceae bacterium]
MAYQPYPYQGFQPAPYYPGPVPDQLAQLRQNQMQQPMMPGAQMPQQLQTMQPNAGPAQPGGGQNSGIVWVSSKLEADSYLVAPNSAVALWDANNPVIYLRQADSTGKPSTKVYDLVERTDNPAPQQSAPQIDLSRYVTIDQLEGILAERLKQPAKASKTKEDTSNE